MASHTTKNVTIQIKRLLKQAESLHHNQILVPGIQTWYNNGKLYFDSSNGKKGTIILDAVSRNGLNTTQGQLNSVFGLHGSGHCRLFEDIPEETKEMEPTSNILMTEKKIKGNSIKNVKSTSKINSLTGNPSTDHIITRRRLAANSVLKQIESSGNDDKNQQIRVLLDDSLHMRGDNMRFMDVDSETTIQDLLKIVKNI